MFVIGYYFSYKEHNINRVRSKVIKIFKNLYVIKENFNVKLCKCGCGTILENQRNTYYKDHSNYCSIAKAKMKSKLKKTMSTPEFRKKISERVKKQWEEPEYRDRYFKTINKPEIKENHKNSIKEGWTPEKRKRHSKIGVELMSDPDRRDLITSKLKEYWSDPENRKKYSGENSCHWRGGLSLKGYCKEFIPPFKEEIKEFDRFVCKNPYCRSGKRLSVHHINYDKKDCHWLNLITVCRSCNTRANFHRKYWQRLYKRIRLYGDYDLQCLFEFGA